MRYLLSGIVLLLMLGIPYRGAYCADTNHFPTTASFLGQTLQLNGTGVGHRFLLPVHVSGLYLTQPSHDRQRLQDMDAPMALRLSIITRIITRSLMVATIQAEFTRATQGNLAPIQTQLAQILQVFNAPVHYGDDYDFIWQPRSQELVFLHNSNEKLRIPGLDFKKVFFSIWLGDNPSEPSIQQGILGLAEIP